jgi:hypothetical protein
MSFSEGATLSAPRQNPSTSRQICQHRDKTHQLHGNSVSTETKPINFTAILSAPRQNSSTSRQICQRRDKTHQLHGKSVSAATKPINFTTNLSE